MPDVLIEDPVLNFPFVEPTRHFVFDEDGITDEIAESRRPSSSFIPVAQPKKKGKQLVQAGGQEGRLRRYRGPSNGRRRTPSWAPAERRTDEARLRRTCVTPTTSSTQQLP